MGLLVDLATTLFEFWNELTRVTFYHILLDFGLLFLIIWLIASARKRHRVYNVMKLSHEEEEGLLSEWKPEPLVPDFDPEHYALNPPIVDGKVGRYMNVDGEDCLNLSTFNFLGFGLDVEAEDVAINCIKKYGVGSCGPRGFYGTAEVHLELEDRLAKLFGCQQAVLYSYGFSTIASAIPAYAKKGDVIFADECVNFAIQKGLDASRSKIKFFKHNDCQHLESLLIQQQNEDAKNPKLAAISRRFLVVEGIYVNLGSICQNLKQMVELKKRFKLRLFIDESISFGTLGSTGLGITEHFNIDRKDVDLIMATLECSMGSIGGFCVGTSYVVEHQTLAGLGYCFSASLPPMLAQVVITAIEKMESNPRIFEDLSKKCLLMSEVFAGIPGLTLSGDDLSPVKHLSLSVPTNSRSQDEKVLRNIVKQARHYGVALAVASYLCNEEVKCPRATIRLTCSVLLLESDILNAAKTLSSICYELLNE